MGSSAGGQIQIRLDACWSQVNMCSKAELDLAPKEEPRSLNRMLKKILLRRPREGDCDTDDSFVRFGKFAPFVLRPDMSPRELEKIVLPWTSTELRDFDPRTLSVRSSAQNYLKNRHGKLSIRRQEELKLLELFDIFRRLCREWTLLAGVSAVLVEGGPHAAARKQLGGKLLAMRESVVREVLLDGQIEPSVLFMLDR